MGYSYPTTEQQRIANEKWNKDNDDLIASERRKLANKIVMMVVDQVVNEIIRPGPKPEERECYEVAAELRAITPKLEELAKKIIDVEGGVE